ncbi:MAG: SusF/SusE family outer membrane protein [Bacteroidetes bacterium]|nr:SusF/SusE family outer membrane protein [Bacteroidota bacterium]
MVSRFALGSLMAATLAVALFSCKKSNDSGSGSSGTVPSVFAENVSDITKTSAWAGGWITSSGSSVVKSKGVCWNTSGNPTLNDHMKLAVNQTGNIALMIDGLSPRTTYHVRLFATNDAGTGYSEDKTFRTLTDSLFLKVSTLAPDLVSMHYAEVGGSVNDTGYSHVTERGICWGSMNFPTVSDNKIVCGSGLGSFSAELHGLTSYARYHYRAYAINAQGLVYGDTIGFTTRGYPLLFVPGTYQGWNPSDSSTVVWSVKDNGKYEGYQWFPANTEYKYNKGNSWVESYGDNNHDGTLELNGANIVALAEGYYKLNVELPNLTHTFLKTSWSVIGSATPNGWNVDTDLSWDPVNKVWSGSVALTAGDFKFRANHNWDLNYGDSGTNGILQQGGSNITVSSAGTYLITLNLNVPVYTYTLVK